MDLIYCLCYCENLAENMTDEDMTKLRKKLDSKSESDKADALDFTQERLDRNFSIRSRQIDESKASPKDLNSLSP